MKGSHAFGLYTFPEAQLFTIAIFEAHDDGHIDQGMPCTSDMKNTFQIKRNANLKIFKHKFACDSAR
jgi:hypothetical protein